MESPEISGVKVLDTNQYLMPTNYRENEKYPRVNNLDEIILHLKTTYPNRNYTPEQTIAYIMYYSGQQSIIKYLEQLQKDIAEQHFSTVSK